MKYFFDYLTKPHPLDIVIFLLNILGWEIYGLIKTFQWYIK